MTVAQDARIEVEDREGVIRVLTLHNPSRRNALNADLLRALADALDLSVSQHVRAILIRGSGGAFSSGYDLAALPDANPEKPGPPVADEFTEPSTDAAALMAQGDDLPDDHVSELLACIAEHPAPSVALIEGPAFGAGCELAATCDFRVGATNAVLCMPPAKLGIVYANEGIAKVARIVGWQRARRMFLTGMRLEAPAALAWGLLDECVEAARAEEVAMGLCREMAGNAPLAVAGMKRAIAELSRLEVDARAEDELRGLRRAAFASADLKEGRAAFVAKRKAQFAGK